MAASACRESHGSVIVSRLSAILIWSMWRSDIRRAESDREAGRVA
jgi:hypothetical protein